MQVVARHIPVLTLRKLGYRSLPDGTFGYGRTPPPSGSEGQSGVFQGTLDVRFERTSVSLANDVPSRGPATVTRAQEPHLRPDPHRDGTALHVPECLEVFFDVCLFAFRADLGFA